MKYAFEGEIIVSSGSLAITVSLNSSNTVEVELRLTDLIRRLRHLLISFVHSLGEGTRPTRGHTKSASISASHRSSSGVPSGDHSLLDSQPRNAHNSLLVTADPLRQRYNTRCLKANLFSTSPYPPYFSFSFSFFR